MGVWLVRGWRRGIFRGIELRGWAMGEKRGGEEYGLFGFWNGGTLLIGWLCLEFRVPGGGV